MKIAINTQSPGTFALSDEAMDEIHKRGLDLEHDDYFLCRDVRTHSIVIKAIELLGDQANRKDLFGERPMCEIKIVEIPDDVINWYIMEDDAGVESIHEGRIWK
jgi:hypothetical protein